MGDMDTGGTAVCALVVVGGWRVGVGVGVGVGVVGGGGGGGVAEGVAVKCLVGVADADADADDVEVEVVITVPETPPLAANMDVHDVDVAAAVPAARFACRQVLLSSNISRCGVFCRALAVFK